MGKEDRAMKQKKPYAGRRTVMTVLFFMAAVALCVLVFLTYRNVRKWEIMTREMPSQADYLLEYKKTSDWINYGSVLYDAFNQPEQLFGTVSDDETTIALIEYLENGFYYRAFERAGYPEQAAARKEKMERAESILSGYPDNLEYINERFEEYLHP